MYWVKNYWGKAIYIIFLYPIIYITSLLVLYYKYKVLIQKRRHSFEIAEKVLLFNILNCKFSLDLQNVRPSVPLNLLELLSNSFNIAHRTLLQYRERHKRIFFDQVIFGPFLGIFRLKKGITNPGLLVFQFW